MVKKRRRSRLSASIQSELIGHFVAAASARSAAEICGVNRNTAILFFHKLRELLADNLAAEAPDLMAGEIEVDESYFGGVRKGKRGRGAAGKIPVFGLLKRGGKVYAVIIPNARTETLLPIIESKIKPDSIVYTDSFKAYDVLDVSDFHHVRINHSQPSPRTATTSTASRTSGTRRNVISGATTASQSITSTSISRSANGASTTAQPPTS